MRRASSADISLKARPNWANSSRPLSGSCWSKSPWATARAREAKTRSVAVSERTSNEARSAITRIAATITPITRQRSELMRESSFACG